MGFLEKEHSLIRSSWSLGTTVRRCGALSLHLALQDDEIAGMAWRCRGPRSLRERFAARSEELERAVAGGLRAATKVGTSNRGSPFRIDAFPTGHNTHHWIEEVRFRDEDIVEIIRSAAQTLADLHAAGIVHGSVSLETLFLEHGELGWKATLWRPAPLLTGFTPEPVPPGLTKPIDARADVFGLGYCIASMILGHPIPRRAPTWLDDRPGAVVEMSPLIRDPTLSLLIHRLIDRSPERRLPASAILDALSYLDRAPPTRLARLRATS